MKLMKKQFFRKAISIVLAFALVFGMTIFKTSSSAKTSYEDELLTAKNTLANEIYEKCLTVNGEKYVPGIDDCDSLYLVFSLVQSGYEQKEYYREVAKKIISQFETLAKGGEIDSEISNDKITMGSYDSDSAAVANYAKIALFMASVGYDIKNIGGVNVLKKILSKNVFEASNPYPLSREALILFVLNATNSDWPKDACVTEEASIDALVSYFDEAKEMADSWGTYDSMYMLIQPLCYYRNDEKYKNLTSFFDKVTEYISNNQTKSGGYASSYMEGDDAYALAMASLALGECRINPFDEKYIKDGKSFVDGIKVFVSDGKVDESILSFQPDQLLRGITSLYNYVRNDNRFYDLTKPKYNLLENNNNPPKTDPPKTDPPKTNPNKSNTNSKNTSKNKKSIPAKKKTPKIGKVKGLKVKRLKKGKIKLTWKKVDKAKGYMIYLYDNSPKSKVRFKYVKKTHVCFSKKKVYGKYVKVRAYITSKKKKIFGKYSQVKKLK